MIMGSPEAAGLTAVAVCGHVVTCGHIGWVRLDGADFAIPYLLLLAIRRPSNKDADKMPFTKFVMRSGETSH
jgi:hypothetical protein